MSSSIEKLADFLNHHDGCGHRYNHHPFRKIERYGMQKSLEERHVDSDHLERDDYRCRGKQVCIGEEIHLEERCALGETVPNVKPLENCENRERDRPCFCDIRFGVHLE